MEKQQIVDNLLSFSNFFSECLESVNENAQTPKSKLHDRAVDLMDTAFHHNGWFTKEAIHHSFKAWSESLNKEKIEKWLSSYDLKQVQNPKKVGVIMAGNIPMVGLHDALSVLISGHHLLAKLSSKDQQLMDLCLEVLSSIDNEWASRISKVERLNDIDMLIATGNDNSARYFEYYFRDTSKIIRKNRSSIAVLSNNVEKEQLEGLAKDVFTYFGLGCRNVSKVYLPQDFDLDKIFGSFYDYKDLINHNQYANNYDYNKAVYLMNKTELLENGFILFKEDEGLHSPLGVLFYERYETIDKLNSKLKSKEDQIQTIVSDLDGFANLGEAQKPELWDYADGIDTLNFLISN